MGTTAASQGYCAEQVIRVISGEDYWLFPLFQSLHSTMEDSHHVSSNSGPLGLVSDVHGVFRNEDLPSTSEEHLRAIAIACSLLEVFFG